MITTPETLTRILVTDCGSTTTKALLFEKTPEGWRQTKRGEAPTTVEEPIADVTVGALNAFEEIEELSNRKILATGDKHPFNVSPEGIDLYLSTSSAGGGLQMVVAGVVSTMTTQSAERAALGAGAIVMEAISADDGREDHERIDRIRHLKPDIVLLTGGVDGGSKTHVVEMAEILLAAAPRPRFGQTLTLPVIYAGNKDAAAEVAEVLKSIAQVHAVPNVRPTLETENITPAREAIHEMFLTHVMSHSPGYDKLLSWTPIPVMPTPAAVGDIVRTYAERENKEVLCVDIGGATTDVFSVFKNQTGEPKFNRTVSANLGMSYSIANVLLEAGIDNIMRWLPYELDASEIKDRLKNKMIRPTTIPQTLEDLWLEQAVCREALRLSFVHHRSLAVGLSGVVKRRGIADIFGQSKSRVDLVNMMNLDVVIGSGGVLSHAPSRISAALMMLDGFELEGFTEVTVDSIFMMPHLGVLAAVHPEAAKEIFEKDCLVKIAHALAPVYRNPRAKGTAIADVFVDGEKKLEVKAGEVDMLPLGKTPITLLVKPRANDINLGWGSGEELSVMFTPGAAGLLIDGRNRPLQHEKTRTQQAAAQKEIYTKLGLIK